MREEHRDLWQDFTTPLHRVAISTNGFVKRNGQAVMGRGCALQATQLFPNAARLLGVYIKRQGNVPGYLIVADVPAPADRLMILPVKDNWWEKANLDLVTSSILFLEHESLSNEDWTFHVPRLGCGNGRLSWANEVQPLMRHLGDNVVVHS